MWPRRGGNLHRRGFRKSVARPLPPTFGTQTLKYKMSILNTHRTIHALLLAFVMTLLCSQQSLAEAPQITAKVDSGNLLMGKMGVLTLQIVVDRGQQFDIPLLTTQDRNGLVSLVGDSIEVRAAVSRDTIPLGGKRIQVNCKVPMQAFVPGKYLLPAIEVTAGNDTAKSNRVALNVTGPDVKATDSISPDFGVIAPYYEKSYQKTADKVPDFLYYYWWLILLGIAVIAVMVIWFMKRKGKALPWRKPKPELNPYEQAMQRLRVLRERNLCNQGMEKEYYSELTNILRMYLWRRFGINALEMTTQQIRNAVRNSPNAKVGKKYIEDVLAMADFVKFAKFKPLPDDNIKAFEDVATFVNQTRPAEKEAVGADSSDAPANNNYVEPQKKSEP